MCQLHVDLTVREIAKFHAISYCLDRSSAPGARLGERYCLLASDSVYRADTVQVLGYKGTEWSSKLCVIQATNRAITPVMAGLAELVRMSPDYRHHYPWFIQLAKVRRGGAGLRTDCCSPAELPPYPDPDGLLRPVPGGRGGGQLHGGLPRGPLLGKHPLQVRSVLPVLRMWIVTKVSRYDEAGEPKEVKFIDFQSSRLSSLVTDLLTLAFTSLSSSLRREHTNTMLEVSGHLHLHLYLSLVL